VVIVSGPAPFGTRWQDGELVSQPAEVPVVVELIEAFIAAGGRMKAAAATLNIKGFRTRRGGRWTDVAVARVLGQEGLRDLVPESLWRRCEGLLAERGNLGRRSAHPLGSVVRCRCQGRMYLRGEGSSGKFVCQECRSKHPSGVLEQKFLESLRSVVLSSQEVVAGLQDDPRAAEVSRAIGGREVSVAEVWPALEPAERRQLVDNLVDHIEVEEGQIRVVLAVPDRFQAETGASQPDSLPSSHDLRARRERPTRQQKASLNRQEDGTAPGSPAVLPLSEPKAYRIRQVARLLNVPKSTAYDLVRTGVLASVRAATGNGRGVVLVPASAVTAFLEEKRRRRYSHRKPSGQKGGIAWP
jgi:excisionase family DNA binding protein